MSAAVVYIHDQTEISHIEIADYRKLAISMLVTDVGGGLYWRVVGDRLFTLKKH